MRHYPPCAHCGSVKIDYHSDRENIAVGIAKKVEVHTVRCMNCGIAATSFLSRASAERAWVTRVN